MNFHRTGRFKKDYKRLPARIKKLFKKQLVFLFLDFHHPSLNIKKMQDPRNIWEGRITDDYRFTFQAKKSVFLFRRVGTHKILKKP